MLSYLSLKRMPKCISFRAMTLNLLLAAAQLSPVCKPSPAVNGPVLVPQECPSPSRVHCSLKPAAPKLSLLFFSALPPPKLQKKKCLFFVFFTKI